MSARLSPLDASFLAVETEAAHMHVGWAAVFDPPPGRAAPEFADVRAQVSARLARAPRYRQKLAPVPLRLAEPEWVDDEDFDLANHLHRAEGESFAAVVDRVMSEPLRRDRPLWELWIADRLPGGRLGIVGKAHHCMVDGIAAVELAALLLDVDPDGDDAPAGRWAPAPRPGAAALVRRAVLDAARDRLGVLRPLVSPRAAAGMLLGAGRAALALAQSGRPARPEPILNPPISRTRHLATLARPFAELKGVARRFDASLNDVLLAAAAGGLRRFLERRGECPAELKAMVPVNLRDPSAGDELGNRISFVFLDLPCGERDAVRRLRGVQEQMSARKRSGAAEGAAAALGALATLPRPLQRVSARAVASPRAYNLTISNIPGPRVPMYMLGCRLAEAYPVVPISDGHALSIGMTSVGERLCFGVYADRATLPDADALAGDIGAAVDELVAASALPAPRAAPAPEPELEPVG